MCVERRVITVCCDGVRSNEENGASAHRPASPTARGGSVRGPCHGDHDSDDDPGLRLRQRARRQRKRAASCVARSTITKTDS